MTKQCCNRRQARGPSVVEIGGQRRGEHEVWDRLGLGGLEGRALIEEEVSLGLRTGGRDQGQSVGQLEVLQDGEDDGWVGKETGSLWTIGGEAVSGPLEGSQLGPMDNSYLLFWFAWRQFQPEGKVFHGG
jgi:Protein of unknown function (DUF3179)